MSVKPLVRRGASVGFLWATLIPFPRAHGAEPRHQFPTMSGKLTANCSGVWVPATLVSKPT